MDTERNQYMYGSAAYDLNYGTAIPKEPNKWDEEPQKVQRPKKKYSLLLYKFKLLFMVCILFLGCMTLLVSYANLSHEYSKIDSLEKQLKEIKNKNTIVTDQIVNNSNLEEIYQRATEELGMVEPTPDQVKYVSVSNASYTQQYEEVLANESSIPIWSKILGIIQ